MTIILKKGISNKEIDIQIIKSRSVQKKHDFTKYIGNKNNTENPLEIQKKMRNEWN